MDILSSFWPHSADVGILGTVQQTLEILEKSILVLVQESGTIINDITGVVTRN